MGGIRNHNGTNTNSRDNLLNTEEIKIGDEDEIMNDDIFADAYHLVNKFRAPDTEFISDPMEYMSTTNCTSEILDSNGDDDFKFPLPAEWLIPSTYELPKPRQVLESPLQNINSSINFTTSSDRPPNASNIQTLFNKLLENDKCQVYFDDGSHWIELPSSFPSYDNIHEGRLTKQWNGATLGNHFRVSRSPNKKLVSPSLYIGLLLKRGAEKGGEKGSPSSDHLKQKQLALEFLSKTMAAVGIPFFGPSPHIESESLNDITPIDSPEDPQIQQERQPLKRRLDEVLVKLKECHSSSNFQVLSTIREKWQERRQSCSSDKRPFYGNLPNKGQVVDIISILFTGQTVNEQNDGRSDAHQPKNINLDVAQLMGILSTSRESNIPIFIQEVVKESLQGLDLAEQENQLKRFFPKYGILHPTAHSGGILLSAQEVNLSYLVLFNLLSSSNCISR